MPWLARAPDYWHDGGSSLSGPGSKLSGRRSSPMADQHHSSRSRGRRPPQNPACGGSVLTTASLGLLADIPALRSRGAAATRECFQQRRLRCRRDVAVMAALKATAAGRGRAESRKAVRTFTWSVSVAATGLRPSWAFTSATALSKRATACGSAAGGWRIAETRAAQRSPKRVRGPIPHLFFRQGAHGRMQKWHVEPPQPLRWRRVRWLRIRTAKDSRQMVLVGTPRKPGPPFMDHGQILLPPPRPKSKVPRRRPTAREGRVGQALPARRRQRSSPPRS